MKYFILSLIVFLFMPVFIFAQTETETLRIETFYGRGGAGISTTEDLELAKDSDDGLVVGDLIGSPINKLEVKGNAAIGAGYAGNSSAPENGLIVEGNVGIGTARPRSKLEVAGLGRFSSSATGSGSSLILDGSGLPLFDSEYSNVRLIASSDSGSGYLKSHIDNWGGAFTWSRGENPEKGSSEITLMTLNATNGNVGIGTAAPGLSLHVSGNEGAPATSGIIQNGHARLGSGDLVLDVGTLVAPAWGAWLQTTNKTDLSNEYNLLLNPNGGNVGIGTTGPDKKLTIVGTSPADTFDAQLCIRGSEITGVVDTGGAINFSGHDGGNDRGWAYIRGLKENSTLKNMAAYLAFGTREKSSTIIAERMRIDSNGNVGIGTTGPRATLEVNGNAKVTGNLEVSSISTVIKQASISGTGVLTATATCDSGGTVLGGGCIDSKIGISKSYPFSYSAWACQSGYASPTSVNRVLTAYAICTECAE